jgi:hypothetical protein
MTPLGLSALLAAGVLAASAEQQAAKPDADRAKTDHRFGSRSLLFTAPDEPFTYVSCEPGRYVRVRHLNDNVAYLEHVDMASGRVTWRGALRLDLSPPR